MKTTLTFLFAFYGSIFFTSCSSTSPTAPTTTTQGVATPVGTPIGSPTTATIDASGGSLMSPDGRLEVIIPANALSAATAISIQPGTNETPLGTGVAYSLTPNGLQFNQPITLRFHYNDSDRAGTDINALDIATQKDDRIWYAAKTVTLDSAAGTLSVSTTHFSWYSIFKDFSLIPDKGEVDVNMKLPLRVAFIPWPPADPNDRNDFGSPLNPANTYPNDDPNHARVAWSVNGKSSGDPNNGYILPGTASYADYLAPASAKNVKPNPVTVAATVDLQGNKKSYNAAKEIVLLSNIKVKDAGESYHVVIDLIGTDVPAGSATFGYVDRASFDIAGDLANPDTLLVSSVVNVPGQVTSWTDNPQSGCTSTHDGEGDLLQIISAAGGMAQHFSGDSTMINIGITGLMSTVPYTMVCNGTTTKVPSYGPGPRDYQATIIIGSAAQTYNLDGDPGMTVTLTITKN